MKLINLRSKKNVINPAYIAKLSFQMQKIDIGAQKLYGLSLKTYSIAIAGF